MGWGGGGVGKDLLWGDNINLFHGGGGGGGCLFFVYRQRPVGQQYKPVFNGVFLFFYFSHVAFYFF